MNTELGANLFTAEGEHPVTELLPPAEELIFLGTTPHSPFLDYLSVHICIIRTENTFPLYIL